MAVDSAVWALVGVGISAAVSVITTYLNNKHTLRREREQWENQRTIEANKLESEVKDAPKA